METGAPVSWEEDLLEDTLVLGSDPRLQRYAIEKALSAISDGKHPCPRRVMMRPDGTVRLVYNELPSASTVEEHWDW